jgi:hypothetical protein
MAKHRNMSDEEVGLVRAMLAKGMKNDQVHFYFNRADRLISSGRVAQIRNGSYAKDVPAASESELQAFLAKWAADHATVYPKGPQSPTDVEYIQAMFEKRKTNWHVRRGETDVVECKLNYAVSGAILKAVAGLTNNKGGHILFGVKDGTNAVEGMSDDKFHTLDPSILNSHLLSTLDPVPTIMKVALSIGGKTVGAIYVEKHPEGPVIAVKNVGSDVKPSTSGMLVRHGRSSRANCVRSSRCANRRPLRISADECLASPLDRKRQLTSILARLPVSRADLLSIRTYCLQSSSSEKVTLAR